jgi:hypothetical protein
VELFQEERQMNAIPRMVCASSGESITWANAANAPLRFSRYGRDTVYDGVT